MGGSGAGIATDTLAFYMFQIHLWRLSLLVGRGHRRLYDYPGDCLVVPYLMSMHRRLER